MNESSRKEQLAILQEHYAEFVEFAEDVMNFLGYPLTMMQADIARFLQYSSGDIMVQAQRSQAKSTITAVFAVWLLIHDPTHRILVVSAAGALASDISKLIVQIILHMPGLDCLRPDRSAGDRTSSESFDIHGSLKGIDKSPSVKCMGITASLQGNRAHTLIADDVESQKNSETAGMREKLNLAIKDFSSIVQGGRVIYLGTPQSGQSIYNSLPAKGVLVRIWPGRYPTPEQLPFYGNLLAPMLLNRLRAHPELGTGHGIDGKQGAPTDPEMCLNGTFVLGEEELQVKEMRQGTAFFQLQHMLCTSILDNLKYPLKPEQLIVMRWEKLVPLSVIRGMEVSKLRKAQIAEIDFNTYWPHSTSPVMISPEADVFYIDPAGGGVNADEVGFAYVQKTNSTLYVRDIGGIPGGYTEEKLNALADRVIASGTKCVKIEKNFGYGAFTAVFTPVLRKKNYKGAIDEDYVTGRKEKRIVDTLAPIIGRGSLVVHEDVLNNDWDSTACYAMDKRKFYTFAYQFTSMTNQSGACVHDDRIDALAGACQHFVPSLVIQQQKAEEKLEQKAQKEFFENPLGKDRYDAPKSRKSASKRRWH